MGDLGRQIGPGAAGKRDGTEKQGGDKTVVHVHWPISCDRLIALT